MCVCVCVCNDICLCNWCKTPLEVCGLAGISTGIIMGVTLTPGYVAAGSSPAGSEGSG